MKKLVKTVVFIFIGCLLLFIGYKSSDFFSKNSYTRELIGDKNTHVYHKDDCKFIDDLKTSELIFFDNLVETAEYGYRPCKSCDPPNNEKELVIVEEERKQQEIILKQQKESIAVSEQQEKESIAISKQQQEESIAESIKSECEITAQEFLDGNEVDADMLEFLVSEGYLTQEQVDRPKIDRLMDETKEKYLKGKQVEICLFARLINSGLISEDSLMDIDIDRFKLQVAANDFCIPFELIDEDFDKFKEVIEKGYVSKEILFFSRILTIDNEQPEYVNSYILWVINKS